MRTGETSRGMKRLRGRQVRLAGLDWVGICEDSRYGTTGVRLPFQFGTVWKSRSGDWAGSLVV